VGRVVGVVWLLGFGSQARDRPGYVVARVGCRKFWKGGGFSG